MTRTIKCLSDRIHIKVKVKGQDHNVEPLDFARIVLRTNPVYESECFLWYHTETTRWAAYCSAAPSNVFFTTASLYLIFFGKVLIRSKGEVP